MREGGLHNLAKTMVSVLHKELELQSVKAQVQWLYDMQPRIKNKSDSPAGEKTVVDQSTWSVTVVIDEYSIS